jgi:hypothetical protein
MVSPSMVRARASPTRVSAPQGKFSTRPRWLIISEISRLPDCRRGALNRLLRASKPGGACFGPPVPSCSSPAAVRSPPSGRCAATPQRRGSQAGDTAGPACALCEEEFGKREQAREDADAAVKLARNREVRALLALALARTGEPFQFSLQRLAQGAACCGRLGCKNVLAKEPLWCTLAAAGMPKWKSGLRLK